MGWRIVKRRIGRAGSRGQRTETQRGWDRTYGEGMWAVGYIFDGDFVVHEDAFERIYCASYEAHFQNNPEDLEELIATAKVLRNPHAEATTGVDLQVPAIMGYLKKHGLKLKGDDVVAIGSWQGEHTHALSVRLSPLHIKVLHSDRMTLENYWQRKKCLAVWED